MMTTSIHPMHGALVNSAIEYQQLYAVALMDDEALGEVPGEISVLLDSLEGDIKRHAAGYASVIRQLQANAKAAADEAARIGALANRYQQQAEWLKDRIKVAMQTLGTRKIDYVTGSVAIQKNGGKRALVVDDNRVPQEFMYTYTEVRVDKEKIRKEIESGKELPFAHLKEQGEHLKIR